MEDVDRVQEYARELSALPDPTHWFEKLKSIRKELGKKQTEMVGLLAKRLWLIKICDSSYPLHPEVKSRIAYKKYFFR